MVSFATVTAAVGGGDDELRILTFPIGLVTGEIPVDVDLGPSAAPATLYLDGERVCQVTAAATRCVVDLGAEPHVHLLELVRRDSGGRAIARAARWVNRPGQEAEAAVLLAPGSDDGVCGGRLLFAHPSKQLPLDFHVEEDGRGLRLGSDGRSFRFPCPDPAVPHLITASAVFPDGARAESVTLVGGFGGAADAGLHALALESHDRVQVDCESLSAALGSGAMPAGDTGFEVVFVLDPRAGYNTLYSSISGNDYWNRAFATLRSAAALWYVIPDSKLSRVNGFQIGRESWLRVLFATGRQKFNGRPRIADAVAASGLVAAAGPRRRAVVLLLAGRSGPDASTYTPAQARAYLSEVGVPLVVLRNGKRHDDGWPEGVPVFQMAALTTALEDLEAALDRQCVVWLPSGLSAQSVTSRLPPGVTVAGRTPGLFEADAEVWRRAEAVARDAVVEADEVATAGDSIDVTATAVLVQARDGDGAGVDDLSAAELTVTEDGRPAMVLGLEPVIRRSPRPVAVAEAGTEAEAGLASEPAASAELPVVVYVDTRLGGTAATSAALAKLQQRAGWLTSLGPVELVLAGTELVAPLTGSRDPDEVSRAFAAAAAASAGRHQVDLLRGRFVREIRRLPKRADSPSAAVGSGLSTVLVAARSALAEEDARIAEALGRLREWAATAGVGPRLLLLVGTSFDEDPLDFYLPFIRQLEPMNVQRAREEFRRPERSDAIVSLGRDLAAAGWTVVPMAASSIPTGAPVTAAEASGSNRFQAFLSAGDTDFTAEEGWLQVNPLTAQRHLAGPSGGTVVYGDTGLDDLEVGSRGWYRLSYQVGRPPDGAAHQLAVTCARSAVELRTTTLVTSGSSEDRAADRLRRLLAGESGAGGIGLRLAIEPAAGAEGRRRQADVAITVDLGPVTGLTAPGSDRTVRVSLAVATGTAQPFVSHSTSQVAGSVTSWRLDLPLVYPAGPARLAVVVEDLASGAWGGTVDQLPP